MRRAPLAALALAIAAAGLVPPVAAAQTPQAAATGALPATAPADATVLPDPVARVLDHPTLAGARAGLLAVSWPDRTVLVSSHARERFAPASVTKLFTTAAALWKLGGAYLWRTPIAYRGDLADGRLRGDLWILGRGAPDLVEEKMWIAAVALAEHGIERIDGDLVVDDRYFEGPPYGRGWPGGRQTTEAYHARISALMANFGAERSGNEWVAVADPPLHFGARFRDLLGKAGVHVRGAVRRPDSDERAAIPPPAFRGTATGRASVPTPLVWIEDITSEPLGRLVMDVNKFSNNIMAESLLRTLGAIEYGAPGTDTKGLAVIADFLDDQIGIPLNGYVQADGSGLSPQNRFSPEQVVRLLEYGETDFHVGPELLASLKISGLDGFAPAPFKYAPLKGELRVKSGHIRGVNTLAGFLHTSRDRRIVFAFMVNGHHAQQWEIDQRMAELAQALMDEY